MIRMRVEDREVQKMLRGVDQRVFKATARALNRTAQGAKTDISREVRDKATVSDKAVKKTLKVDKARLDERRTPRASVISTGSPLPLIGFKVRQTKAGVLVQVYKDRGWKLIKHAFIRTLDTGHKAVFWRKWKGPRKEPKKNFNYAALPEKFKIPIKERYGPSIQDILRVPKVWEGIKKKIAARMEKNLAHEIKYAMDIEK